MAIGRRTFTAATAAVIIGLSAAPAVPAEVTLRGASCFPINSIVSKPFEAYVNEVNKEGKGIIQIKLLGGAPAIGSPFTMTQKLSKGVFDIIGCPDGYTGAVIKETPALRLSDFTPSESRKNGGFAYMGKIFEAKNIKFIVRHASFGPYYLWLNKKIDKPDLTGLHLRVAPVYVAFFTSLGATVQRSNIAQIYSYMENGTVAGFGWPAMGWIPAWAKVTKYRVEPGFYSSTIMTLANLKVWNGLTDAQRGVLMRVGLKHERTNAAYGKRLAKQKAWQASQGVKTIEFKGADREKWVKAAKDTAWAEVIKKSPKHGPVLRKLFSK